MKRLAFVLLIALLFLMLVGSSAVNAAQLELGAVGFRTFSGKTLAGVSVGFHVIPTGKSKMQNWAAQHITLDVLQAGASLDATSASLGTSVNLLAPEGRLKLGITYLWSEREPAAYLGWSLPIK